MLSTDTFVLNSRYRDYVHGLKPRPREWSAAPFGCLTLWMLPFLAAGVLTLYFALHAWYLWAAFNSVAVLVEATVEEKGIAPDSEGADDPYLTYSYEVPQGRETATYTDRAYVSEHDYERFEQGGTIRILYLPSDPQETLLPGTNRPDMALFLTVFTLFWNGMMVTMSWLLLREWLKNLAFARGGRLVQGTVTRYETSTDSDGDLWVTIGYRFLAPDGQWVEGKNSGLQNGLKDAASLPSGTPVAVLYIDPKRHKLL